jgi:hypothetical protein
VAQFKHLETKLSNQNLIQEEIERTLDLVNVFHYLVQNPLFSHLLSKNIKIGIHKTIILPAILYGWEIQSLTLKEQY